MAYLFSTPEQQSAMLRTIGVGSVSELFDQIPADLRLNRDLELPPPLTELELERQLQDFASRNRGASGTICFQGGGAYDHFIPAAIDAVASRSEFYTAYTPYQAEASQGSLQAFFEFQSLICRLTGMEVSNASLYEGGTAVSEAVFMAMRVTGCHSRVVVLGSINPDYRAVVETYSRQINCEVVVVETPEGTADLKTVQAALNDQTACLVIQHPNYFGCLEEVESLVAAAHEVGALAIVSFDPLSLGLLKRPGEYGADIAVAEGQSLGIPLQYGGPYLGIMTCRNEFVRKMPGRLIGETTDREGKRCFVLNLQAREQHIRREKATSNICTNQGLMALRATVYLALLGPQGLREVSELCCRKAHYAAEQLACVNGLSLTFDRPFFKEFSLSSKSGSQSVQQQAASAGISIGPLVENNSEALLCAVTEKRTREEIDLLSRTLA